MNRLWVERPNCDIGPFPTRSRSDATADADDRFRREGAAVPPGALATGGRPKQKPPGRSGSALVAASIAFYRGPGERSERHFQQGLELLVGEVGVLHDPS